MAIAVTCFCAYLTDITFPWRGEDHNSHKFIQAVKEEPLNQYARVPVCGVRRKLQNSNRDSAFEWFGDIAAEYIAKKHKKRPLALAPIPSSGCVVGYTKVFTALRLANALAARLEDVLV